MEMRKLRIARSMILSFAAGLIIGNVSNGVKICIIVPLIILWFMSLDFAAERSLKELDVYAERKEAEQ